MSARKLYRKLVNQYSNYEDYKMDLVDMIYYTANRLNNVFQDFGQMVYTHNQDDNDYFIAQALDDDTNPTEDSISTADDYEMVWKLFVTKDKLILTFYIIPTEVSEEDIKDFCDNILNYDMEKLKQELTDTLIMSLMNGLNHIETIIKITP